MAAGARDMAADQAVIGEATELLQNLIRTHCVNDGTAASGDEVRNSGAAGRTTSAAAGSSSSVSKAHQAVNLSLPGSTGATRPLRPFA